MSTSSHVLRKLGMLAAVGTATLGGLNAPVTSAQQLSSPSLASAELPAVDLSTRWGAPPKAPEASKPNTQPLPVSATATKAESPYRAAVAPSSGISLLAPPVDKAATANRPVDLATPYQPQVPNSTGANQPAAIGTPVPTPKPKVALQVEKPADTATDKKHEPVDLSSAYQPAASSEKSPVVQPILPINEGQAVRYSLTDDKPETAETAEVASTEPASEEAVSNREEKDSQPTAELAVDLDEPKSSDTAEQPVEEENVEPTPTIAEVIAESTLDDENVADVEVTEPESTPAAKPSLLEAMLAGKENPTSDEGAVSVDQARRMKQCYQMLGFVAQQKVTEPTCTECAQQPTPADSTPVQVASEPAEPSKTESILAETNVSPATEVEGNLPPGVPTDTLAAAPEPTTTETVQTPTYPTTAAPAFAEAAVADPAVSPAAHMVPAQWQAAPGPETQPRPFQLAQGPGNPFADDPVAPGQSAENHFEVIQEQSKVLEVRVRRSLLLRTPFDIYRTAVVDSSICDVVQFTPREVSIIGKASGSTNVTFWFEDGNHRPVTYVVRVIPDLDEKSQTEVQYRMLEDVINELFPDSKVRLIVVADKLIVKGQAASAEDAANIMSIIRGQQNTNIANNRNFLSPAQGFATNVFTESETGRNQQPRVQVINMLQVPGIQQVALRVKIAQLNRSAARGFGIDAEARINFGGGDEADSLFVQSLLNMAAGNAPSVITEFDDANINLGLRYLQQQGVIRLLSEPTLVTLSGRPATFVSGGEFAVPTIVGGAGVNAVTTDFRAFGVIVSFLPTVLDKDRVRLQVAPEFSQINQGLNSAGTFGLNTNAVTTTVEMREGQTLAIAGLLEDTMKNSRVGNVPYLERIFGTRDTARNESELIILVTPELVHPMEAEEVPPLPGFDVTEPTNKEFYWHGHLEGHPTSGYRSTVWPELRRRYRAGGPSMTSGPFGHGQ